MSSKLEQKVTRLVLDKYPEAPQEVIEILNESYLEESKPLVKGLGRRCSAVSKHIGTMPPILNEQLIGPTTGEIQAPEASYESGEIFRSHKEPIRYKVAKKDGLNPAFLNQND